jgi:hypothetical protein
MGLLILDMRESQGLGFLCCLKQVNKVVNRQKTMVSDMGS